MLCLLGGHQLVHAADQMVTCSNVTMSYDNGIRTGS
jgi:hypothetical protein